MRPPSVSHCSIATTGRVVLSTSDNDPALSGGKTINRPEQPRVRSRRPPHRPASPRRPTVGPWGEDHRVAATCWDLDRSSSELRSQRADSAEALGMARIRAERLVDRTRGVVAGRLTVADMARLELAGSAGSPPARHHWSPPPLEIDLRGVTHTDRTAATLLRYLECHGAVLTGVSSSS
jgi:hypothetical protein